ncbi:LysR family transcriptional regulator [Vibrio hannami]|uniref:LysR family transcriptional regulator n=1 Tax=Vibrio hannami TaxID=2717094 RepID=UPI0024103277|nr:LysR family transcriptional regulator [Vibrio hannami]MDG3087458.1 LysR family transcriptional regulator [Vibrio hannami]
MDLANKLELLLDVANYGSFARVADSRNIDRSSLSKQIKQLEDSLGVRLLNRTTRSLSLTSVGEDVVMQARKIADLLDETRFIAETSQTEAKGHIRISSSTFFGRKYLQQAVNVFASRYPNSSIEMHLDDNRVDMVGERFDIVFRIGPIRDSSMIARRLAPNDIALIASRDFIKTHGMPRTPDELVNLPAVIYSNGNVKLDKLHVLDGPNFIEPRIYTMQGQYSVNETELIIDAVRSGLGYGMLGHFVIPDELEAMGLVQLLPEYDIPSYGDIYAMYAHRAQPPLVKAFLDIVQNTIIGTPPVWSKNFSRP